MHPKIKHPIPALLPRDKHGLQFVTYADCCSGIPGTENERTFARINTVLQALQPQPEFICFPGDEIRGLTLDEEELRRQWRYWQETEMAWLKIHHIPLYHTTGNHTAGDAVSAKVFQEMLADLPQNGPPGQKGLSYYVRRNNTLLIFANTLNLDLGGEGYVETDWLQSVLNDHRDAWHKLVFGHHPAFPVNGFSGPYQRQIGPACTARFWTLLVEHGVRAYVCSHMLAFDVQVHQGVLQIMTAGAGTAPLMPVESEYHHLVQLAVDDTGLRYQTLDFEGRVRERLAWPPRLPPQTGWQQLEQNTAMISPMGKQTPHMAVWQFTGCCVAATEGRPQTLISGYEAGDTPSQVWIGLRGLPPRLSVLMRHTPGRSPHLWLGPEFIPGKTFDLQVALYPDMGPGGVLSRPDNDAPWTSLSAASSWGPERLQWPAYWVVGQDGENVNSQPFRGSHLHVRMLTL